MWSRFIRALSALELEERILNAGALVTVLGLFFPWISGEWLGGDMVSYSGFQSYTSVLGFTILLLNLFLLSLTVVPLAGGPLILRKRYREIVRLFVSAQSTILVMAILSVLTNITFEFSRVEVRFGIYITLIGSLVTSLYCFLRYQEQRRMEVQDLFHHPEDRLPPSEREESPLPPPPPPPPPPPLEPEEHHLRP